MSASSSLGVPPLQPPRNYTGSLTHGEFVSCEGQILPPAYSVGGTWVLNIDMMTQPQVPPPAHLTMVVFRDGSRIYQLHGRKPTLVAVASAAPIGLTIEGKRIAWAESVHGKGRIRAVAVR